MPHLHHGLAIDHMARIVLLGHGTSACRPRLPPPRVVPDGRPADGSPIAGAVPSPCLRWKNLLKPTRPLQFYRYCCFQIQRFHNHRHYFWRNGRRQVEGYMPCPCESWTPSRPWTDVDSLAYTTCCYQWPKPARGIRTLVFSRNAQTYTNVGSRGEPQAEPTAWCEEDIVNTPSIHGLSLSGNYFPSSMDQSTSRRQALPQSVPRDQELSTPAPIGQGIPYSSSSFPSHQISHVSLENQGGVPEVPRGSPHPASNSIETFGTSPYSRHPSSKQQSKQHNVRYRCEICRKEFAQRQGVRRHQREKHEPNCCPHCPFRWGRPYQFKEHLKKKHPEVDLETVMLARRGVTEATQSLPSIRHTLTFRFQGPPRDAALSEMPHVRL